MALVVIDELVQRSSQMAYSLRTLGRVYEARAPQEIQTILDREGKIDAFLVSADLGADVVRKLKSLYDYPVFVYGDMSPGTVAEMFRAGVEDMFPYPVEAKWLEERLERMADVRPVSFADVESLKPKTAEKSPTQNRLERPLDLPDPAPESEYAEVTLRDEGPKRTLDRLIVSGSVKGGDGKTSLLTQIGMVLGKKGLRPLILDADPSGNAAQWIGADVVDDISEFASRKSFSERDLEAMLVMHRASGLKVLPSPLGSAEPIRWETLRAAVEAYRPLYPFLAVDLPEGISPALLHLGRDYATDVFLMMSPDASRLQRSLRMLETLIRQGVPPKKLRIVVNRVKKESDFRVIQAALAEVSDEVAVYPLPYHPALDNPTRTGMPPVVVSDPKSAYAKAFRRILEEVFRVKAGPSAPAGDETKKAGAKRPAKSGFSLKSLLKMVGVRG
ncbi:MAG TPA: AAA family ATPase [Alicyclobacillus sp.]|nr:AAA family ATPase [Alicyclobacillus sp.]